MKLGTQLHNGLRPAEARAFYKEERMFIRESLPRPRMTLKLCEHGSPLSPSLPHPHSLCRSQVRWSGCNLAKSL